MIPVYNDKGDLIGLQDHNTTHSVEALGLILERLGRAEAEVVRLTALADMRGTIIADLREQVSGLLDLLGRPSIPRMEGTSDE